MKTGRGALTALLIIIAGCGKDPCGNLDAAITQAKTMKGCSAAIAPYVDQAKALENGKKCPDDEPTEDTLGCMQIVFDSLTDCSDQAQVMTLQTDFAKCLAGPSGSGGSGGSGGGSGAGGSGGQGD